MNVQLRRLNFQKCLFFILTWFCAARPGDLTAAERGRPCCLVSVIVSRGSEEQVVFST